MYFEGYGWVDFEPTPAFVSTMSYAKFRNTIDDSANLIDGSSEYMDFVERMNKQYNSGLMSENEGAFNSTSKFSIWMIVGILLWAIAILFIGILFFILIKLIGLRLRYRRYNRVETKEAILLYYSFFIQVLKRMGYKIEAGSYNFV